MKLKNILIYSLTLFLLINICYSTSIQERFGGTDLKDDFANVSSIRSLPFTNSQWGFNSSDTGYEYYTFQAGVTGQTNPEGWQTRTWFTPANSNAINISIDGFTNFIGYKTIFTDPLVMNDTTFITLYYNNTHPSGNPSEWVPWFVWLLDENGRENLSMTGGAFPNFHNLAFCGGTYIPLVAGKCENPVIDMTPTAQRITNNTAYTISLKNASVPHDVYYGMAVGFLKSGVNAEDLVLGGYDIIGVANGTNNLPIGTVEFVNSTVCLDIAGGQQSINISYNIDLVDPENDEILYSTNNVDSTNQNLTIDFDQVKCRFFNTFCDNKPDYSFLEFIYYPTTDTCQIQPNPTVNASNFNLFWLPTGIYNFYMAGNCDGSDKSVYFDTRDNYRKFFLDLNIIDFGEGETFNVTGWDNTFQEKGFVINFNHTANKNVTLSYLNESDQFQEFATILIVDDIQLAVQNVMDLVFIFDIDGDKDLVELENNLGLGALEFFQNNNVSAIRGVSVSIDENTDLFIEKLQISGSAVIRNFTSTVPEFETVDRLGLLTYEVSVTDEVNINSNNFDVYRTSVTVVDCRKYIDRSGLGTVRGYNIFRGFQGFRTAVNNGCTAFDSALGQNRFGSCLFLNLGYIFFCLFVTFMFSNVFSMIDETLGISMFFISFTISIWFGNFLLVFSNVFLAIVSIVGAFGVIDIVRMIFSKRGTNG